MSGLDCAVERARQLVQTGRHAAAESALLAALERTVDITPVAYRLLADIEQALDNPARELHALEALLAVLRAQDDQTFAARVWARVATLRSRLGDAQGALAAWRSASMAVPDALIMQQGLARARFAAQDLDGVRASAAELLRQFPAHSFTHLYHGHLQKAVGETDAASESYRRALELDPQCGEAIYSLVELPDHKVSSALRAQAMELADRDGSPPAERINAAFAMARILDREREFQQAFKYLRRANEWARSESERSGRSYDRAAAEARVAQTMAQYPRTTFRAAIGALAVEFLPIFVVGPPRSGTTLIEQILGSHSRVDAGGELTAAPRSESEFRRSRAAAGRHGPVDPAHPVDAGLLETARERYVEALFERGLSGPLVVDKLPANFEIAGFLRAMFPDAQILHSVRDMRATGFSLYSANFGAHESWYHDLEDLAHYLGLYRRLMRHWQEVITPPLAPISYERLVRDPEEQIPALLQLAGLAFEPACLEYYRSERPILTASHAQVRRPAYTSAIDHWRNYSDWLGPVAALSSG
ncbi:MAG: sulfotransferase [Xanthomonadales bacterium]|nr:sulfotransferase [Xanthomonadales bacterium]